MAYELICREKKLAKVVAQRWLVKVDYGGWGSRNETTFGMRLAQSRARDLQNVPGLKRLSVLLRWKMPQLASLWVKPGIPEIKRLMLPRKRTPEIQLSFGGYTPRVGAFIERDGACCFTFLVGQVRYLRGHSGPHQERPAATSGP
jgi:hypothetical protein